MRSALSIVLLFALGVPHSQGRRLSDVLTGSMADETLSALFAVEYLAGVPGLLRGEGLEFNRLGADLIGSLGETRTADNLLQTDSPFMRTRAALEGLRRNRGQVAEHYEHLRNAGHLSEDLDNFGYDTGFGDYIERALFRSKRIEAVLKGEIDGEGSLSEQEFEAAERVRRHQLLTYLSQINRRNYADQRPVVSAPLVKQLFSKTGLQPLSSVQLIDHSLEARGIVVPASAKRVRTYDRARLALPNEENEVLARGLEIREFDPDLDLQANIHWDGYELIPRKTLLDSDEAAPVVDAMREASDEGILGFGRKDPNVRDIFKIRKIGPNQWIEPGHGAHDELISVGVSEGVEGGFRSFDDFLLNAERIKDRLDLLDDRDDDLEFMFGEAADDVLHFDLDPEGLQNGTKAVGLRNVIAQWDPRLAIFGLDGRVFILPEHLDVFGYTGPWPNPLIHSGMLGEQDRMLNRIFLYDHHPG